MTAKRKKSKTTATKKVKKSSSSSSRSRPGSLVHGQPTLKHAVAAADTGRTDSEHSSNEHDRYGDHMDTDDENEADDPYSVEKFGSIVTLDQLAGSASTADLIKQVLALL